MGEKKDRLKTYKEKRRLEESPEPSGKEKKKKNGPLFVVQKHDASTLHYDFRLEVGGVLKSWAVPKGPSTDPSEKRLALPTEDHPLDYAYFEGVIPEDHYGAGTVIVWDRGAYENHTEDDDGNALTMTEALKEGRVVVELKGKKLKGNFALIRTGSKDDGRWLLMKMKDDEAQREKDILKDKPKSIQSEKTIKQVEKALEDE